MINNKRLGAVTNLSSAWQTIYQVPSGKNAIVRSLIVCNNTGVSKTYNIAQGNNATNETIFVQASVAANDLNSYAPEICMNAGDKINIYSTDAAKTMSITTWGSELNSIGESLKTLGNKTCATNIATCIYKVPTVAKTSVSIINICNTSSSSRTYRLAHVDGLIANVATEDYIAYDKIISAYTTIQHKLKMSMVATDSILFRADGNAVCCIAWGSEIS